jgi:hypothetical protein
MSFSSKHRLQQRGSLHVFGVNTSLPRIRMHLQGKQQSGPMAEAPAPHSDPHRFQELPNTVTILHRHNGCEGIRQIINLDDWRWLGSCRGGGLSPATRDPRGIAVWSEASTKGHPTVGRNACFFPLPDCNYTAGSSGRDQGARGCQLVPGRQLQQGAKTSSATHANRQCRCQGHSYLCNAPAARLER